MSRLSEIDCAFLDLEVNYLRGVDGGGSCLVPVLFGDCTTAVRQYHSVLLLNQQEASLSLTVFTLLY